MNQAGREILWNVHTTFDVFMMYALLAVSLVIAFAGILSRVELWSRGKEAPEYFGNWGQRLDALCLKGLFQRKVVRQGVQAAFHTFIYLGFLVLLFTTTMVFIDHDLGINIYQGKFYLAVTILSDLFGVVLLLGVALAWYRRAGKTTDMIHSKPLDYLSLQVLALLVVQGYLLEGLRIHATQDPWAIYSPIGLGVANLFWSLTPFSAEVLHYGIWWFHTLTVFTAVAVLPYTKFFHIISSSANIFFQDLTKPAGQMRSAGDLEKRMEEEEDFSVGISSLADHTWRDLLSLDACTSCGRCQDACPAYAAGMPLSPKWVVLDSRNHALAVHAEESSWLPSPLKEIDRWLIKNLLLRGSGVRPKQEPGKYAANGAFRGANKNVQQNVLTLGGTLSTPMAQNTITDETFWSCTTCMACVESCPVEINPLELILEHRRSLTLMDGSLPAEAQSTLRALDTRGNPYGPPQERSNWSNGFGVPLLEEGAVVDYLYWVGCVSAFDARKQKIAQSLTKIMQAADLSFGILGSRESCSGDPARRLGEENLFQTLAKSNLSALATVTFKTLVTNCPHCMNTLRHEYPEFSDSGEKQLPFRVIHHTQLINELINDKKITLEDSDLTVTFHDPCYLGRYNDEYDAPRSSLKAIPGLQIVEMEKSREKSMCCGAGGGHFWMDLKNGESRVNTLRTEQAAETKASCIATACPFCMQMLEDGAKELGQEEHLLVKDVAELVSERLVSK